MDVQIDQFIHYLGYGDAISGHAIWIRDTLRRLGHSSDIYAATFDPRMKGEGEHFKKYRRPKGGKLLYHYCTVSEVSDFLVNMGRGMALVYHNITPSRFFRGVSYQTERITKQARDELPRFVGLTELALGVSELNRRELEEAGYGSTAILPIALDARSYALEPDPSVLSAYDDGRRNVIFVGRIVPNKKQEDVIKVYAYYCKAIDPDARLFLVGSSNGTDTYRDWLMDLLKKLDLHNVRFVGHVTQAELVAYYQLSRVFVCMSEHEGFCVPLLEAMHFRLPVVAYACAGVSWTLGDAGILLRAKEYDVAAELLHLLDTDEELRKKVIERQSARLQDFAPEGIARMLGEYLGI